MVSRAPSIAVLAWTCFLNACSLITLDGLTGAGGASDGGGSPDGAGGDAGEGTASDASEDAGAFFLRDLFMRPDNSTTLGNLDTGQTWLYSPPGSTWGIDGDRAALFVAAPNQPQTDNFATTAGRADISVRATLATVGQYAGIVFRYSDPGNCWKFGTNLPDDYLFTKYVGGTQTFISSSPGIAVEPKDGDVLEVVAAGPHVTLYVNGAVVFEFGDATDGQTATGVGLFAGSNDLNTRFRDFVATVPPAVGADAN